MGKRLRVAAIITIYHPKSHADVIVTKFLKGASIDEGRYVFDDLEIVSIYLDHALENDIGLGLAEQFGVPVYPSIRRALHAGSNELNVDAVLLVGEHGDYPSNERGRHMYPRRYFFEQIAGVFSESGRSVPVFNDKHLAYSFADAQWMWERAAELKIPLMAGSSLPLCWRHPWLEYDKGSVELVEALAISYGSIEAYGYHALETMQCMVERRRGGETGVVSVQCLEGDEVWRSRDRGEWSGDLAAAALAVSEHKSSDNPEDCKEPAVFLIRYADGLRGTVLHLGGIVQEFAYAARHANGHIDGVEFYLQNEGPFAHFGYLCRNVEQFFQSGVAPYPPHRTLLTTGIIDAVMNSRHEDHRVMDTTQDLQICYESYDQMPFRPRGERPVGASIDPAAADIV